MPCCRGTSNWQKRKPRDQETQRGSGLTLTLGHRVTDLEVVPKHFFSPQIVEKRKPLSRTARRAGWEGCNIVIDGLPASGRIALIRDGEKMLKAEVIQAWRTTMFLRQHMGSQARRWLLSVMRCVERLGPTFTLAEVYAFEGFLSACFPGNRHVRPKIRQQLQVLRDNGYLEFLGQGLYRRRR